MSTMPSNLRHAQHVGNPDPECEICVLKAEQRQVRTHQQDMASIHESLRAIGGYVQQSSRYIR